MESTIDTLKRTDLFSVLDDEVLGKIAAVMERRQFARGALIFRQGEPGDAFYLLEKGSVQVFTSNAEMGIEFELARLEPGRYFGEMAILTGHARSAGIRALEPVDTLVLSSKAFMSIMVRLPRATLALAQELARRVDETNREQGIQFRNLSGWKFDRELYTSFPKALLERHQVIPLTLEGRTLTLAMARPENRLAIDDIRASMHGVSVVPVAIGESQYRRFVQRHLSEAGAQAAGPAPGQTATAADIPVRYFTPYDTQPTGAVDTAEVGRIVDRIFVHAIVHEASDIHVTPDGPTLAVRFRTDGQMREWERTLPAAWAPSIASRIKVLAGMDIANRRIPQDGRFSLESDGVRLSVRAASIPCRDGERLTLRLFNTTGSMLPLEQIFLADGLAGLVRRLISRENGLILITGPTGSGKTTTLYSALMERTRRGAAANIMTVEDPIEYALPGVTQVQVQEAAGLDFPEVLRSFLRHDPDVIMVGETRDEVTAKIAVQAALTGHLVLTSMHTISTLGTIERLEEMGIPPFLLATALVGIVSQHLVRRNCTRCSSPSSFPAATIERLTDLGVLKADEPIELHAGSGCDFCHQTGYHGRVGVFEVLPVNAALQEVLAAGTTGARRLEAALEHGLVPMASYARFLLRQRLTTPAELLRVFAREE